MNYELLADVAQIIMGQSPPSATYNTVGEGLPFYQGKKDYGEKFPTPRVWCSGPIKIVEAGDILISVVGTPGYATIVDSSILPAIFSCKSTAFRTNSIDPYYFIAYLNSKYGQAFLQRSIRGALMKIDIEGSESFVVESGNEIFDRIDIPFVQMEWLKVRQYPNRVKVIMEFFAKRNYDPRTFSCQLLDPAQHMTWPGDMCWIKRNISNFC